MDKEDWLYVKYGSLNPIRFRLSRTPFWLRLSSHSLFSFTLHSFALLMVNCCIYNGKIQKIRKSLDWDCMHIIYCGMMNSHAILFGWTGQEVSFYSAYLYYMYDTNVASCLDQHITIYNIQMLIFKQVTLRHTNISRVKE